MKNIDRPNWMTSAVVPIVVALVGLIGVVVAALLARADGEDGSTASKGVLVEVSGWGSENVPPPPSVAVRFSGSASGLGWREEILVVAEFSQADRTYYRAVNRLELADNYAVSPVAKKHANGSWEITWVLPRAPASARYTAVVARPTLLATPAATCTPGLSCAPSTPKGPFIDPLVLARDGADSAIVVAKVEVSDHARWSQ